FMKRPQLFGMFFQLCLDFGPFKGRMTVHIFSKRSFKELSNSSRCFIDNSLILSFVIFIITPFIFGQVQVYTTTCYFYNKFIILFFTSSVQSMFAVWE